MDNEAHDTAELLSNTDKPASDTNPMAQAESELSSLSLWIILDCDKVTYITDFKVSATVLKFASEPFRRAFDSEAVEQLFPGPFPCVKTQAPSVVIFRATANSFGLGLRASSDHSVLAWKNEIRNAMQVVLDILHLKVDYECSLKPWELALMAEVAFALDCVTPVLPWLNMWLPLVVKSSEEYNNWIGEKVWGRAHEHVRGIVGFVMGDADTFSEASVEWTRKFPLDISGDTTTWSLVVFPMIKDSICQQRDVQIDLGLEVLSTCYEDYSTNYFNDTIVRRHYDTTLGVFMATLYPFWEKGLGLKGKSFTWDGTLGSLYLDIMDSVMIALKNIPQEEGIAHASGIFEDRYCRLIYGLSRGVRLQLDHYRPGAKKLLDVNKLVPNFSKPKA